MKRVTDIEHRDGVPWHDAPRPRRWHKCKPQTIGHVDFERVERCACGAIRLGFSSLHWINKNERRKS